MTIDSKTTPKLITLNCSGGISLGAYMAGVFYELTKEAARPEPKINIDIITGASAGAMSGLLATYCLLCSHTNQLSKDDERESPLYKAWVEKADIRYIDSCSVMLSSFRDGIQATAESFDDSFQKTLENYRKSSNPIKKTLYKVLSSFKKAKPTPQETRQRKKLSILSGKAIEDIATLVQDPPKISKDTKPLALLMTLTNLQGLLEEINLSTSNNSTGRDIETITSAETRQFLFHSELEQETMDKMWAKAVISSRASGALPVAFPPIWDDSNISSVNLKWLSNDYFQPGSHRTKLKNQELESIRKDEIDDTQLVFLYSDGGILDSLPILKAIDLETELRSRKKVNHGPQLNAFQKEFKEQRSVTKTERLHVYIRPIPVENLNSDRRLTTGHFSMIDIGISGLTLPSVENDSIRLKEIEKRNKMVSLKHKLLKEIESRGIEDTSKIKETLEEAIPYQPIELCPITAAIIGKIADLEKYPKLSKLYPIYAAMPAHLQTSLKEGNAAELLASDFLGAFGGFFDERYRAHDFLIGRICGITWLIEQCNVEIDEQEVQTIVGQIKTKLLKEDPKPSDLKLSQKIMIGRIVLRALRIVVIESKIIGLTWILILGILKLSVIFLLAVLELLVTLILIISDLIEKIVPKMDG